MAFAYGDVQIDINDGSFNRQAQHMKHTWKSAMDSMKAEAASFDARWEEATAGIKDTKRIISGILVSQAFYSLSNSLMDASAAALQFSKDMETAAISMQYFVDGSNKAAKSLAYLREIKQFAARTPFSTEEALSLSKYMQAMGVGMQNTVSFLKVITDTASATGATEQNLQRITFGLGQMMTKGRLANEEIRQLANANIPIYDILQEELGLTGDQISKIGNYWVDADKAVVAILRGLEKRYAGAADKVAETVTGMTDTLKDNALIIIQEAGENTYKAFEEQMRKVRNLSDQYRELATDLGSAGLFTHILESIDESGTVGTMVLSSIGNVRQLTEALEEAFIAGKPFFELLGTAAYSEINTLGFAMTAMAKSLTYIVTALDKAGEELGGIGDLAEKTAAGLASLFVIYKVAGAVSFLGQGLMKAGSGFVAFATTAYGVVPSLAAASTGVKVLTAGVAGLLSALFLIPSALNMLTGLSGLDASSSNTLPDDYMSAYEEYKTAMDEYNSAISKYQEDYSKPFEDIAGNGEDAVSAFEDVTSASKKASKSVKKDWIAAFDEVYSIPKESGTSADSILPDFGASIKPLKVEFPSLEDALLSKPVFDWDKVFSGSTLADNVRDGVDASSLATVAGIVLSSLVLGKRFRAGAAAAESTGSAVINSKIFNTVKENLDELNKVGKRLESALKILDDDTIRYSKAAEAGDIKRMEIFRTKIEADMMTSEKLLGEVNGLRNALGKAAFNPSQMSNAASVLQQAEIKSISARLEEISKLIENPDTKNLEGLLKESQKLTRKLDKLTVDTKGSIDDIASDVAAAQRYLLDITKQYPTMVVSKAGRTEYDSTAAARILEALSKFEEQLKRYATVTSVTHVGTAVGDEAEAFAEATKVFRTNIKNAAKVVAEFGDTYNSIKPLEANRFTSESGAIKDALEEIEGKLREATTWSDNYISSLSKLTTENIEAAKAKQILADEEARVARLNSEAVAKEAREAEKARKEALKANELFNTSKAAQEAAAKADILRPEDIKTAIASLVSKPSDTLEDIRSKINDANSTLRNTKELLAEQQKGKAIVDAANKALSEQMQKLIASGVPSDSESRKELRSALRSNAKQQAEYATRIEEQSSNVDKLSKQITELRTTENMLEEAIAAGTAAEKEQRTLLYKAIHAVAGNVPELSNKHDLGISEFINTATLDEGFKQLADTLGTTVDELVASGTKMFKLSEGVGSFSGSIASMIGDIFKDNASFAGLVDLDPTDFSKNIMALGNELEDIIISLAKDQLDQTEFGTLYKGINAAYEDALRTQIDSIMSNGKSVLPVDVKTMTGKSFKNILEAGEEYITGITKLAASKFKTFKPEYYTQFAAQALTTGSNTVGMTMFDRDFDFGENFAKKLSEALGSNAAGGSLFSPKALDLFQKRTGIEAGSGLIQKYMERVIVPMFTNSVTGDINLAPLRQAMHTVLIEYPKEELEKLGLVFKSSKWKDLLTLAGSLEESDNLSKLFNTLIEVDTAIGKEIASLDMSRVLRSYSKMSGSPTKWLQSITGTTDKLSSGIVSQGFKNYVDAAVKLFQLDDNAKAFTWKIDALNDSLAKFIAGGEVGDDFANVFDGMKNIKADELVKISAALDKLSNTPKMLNELPRSVRTVLDDVRRLNEYIEAGAEVSNGFFRSFYVNARNVFADLGIAASDSSRTVMQQLSSLVDASKKTGRVTVTEADRIELPFRALGIEESFDYIASSIAKEVEAGTKKIKGEMLPAYQAVMKRSNKKFFENYFEKLRDTTRAFMKNTILDLETTGLNFDSDIMQIAAMNPDTGEHYNAFINRGAEENARLLDIMQNMPGDLGQAWSKVTVDMLNQGRSLEAAIDDLRTLIGDRFVTGYNALGFDINVLENAVGDGVFKAGEDLMQVLGRQLDENFLKLTQAYTLVTGMNPGDAHLANVDVDMTYEIAKAIDSGFGKNIATLANVLKERTNVKASNFEWLSKSSELLRQFGGDMEAIMTKLSTDGSDIIADIAASMTNVNVNTDNTATKAFKDAIRAEVDDIIEETAEAAEEVVETLSKEMQKVDRLFTEMDALISGGTFQDLEIAAKMLKNFGDTVRVGVQGFGLDSNLISQINKTNEEAIESISQSIAAATGKNAEKIKKAIIDNVGADIITGATDTTIAELRRVIKSTVGKKLYALNQDVINELLVDTMSSSVDKLRTADYAKGLNIAADSISEEAVRGISDVAEKVAAATAEKTGTKIGAKISDVVFGNAALNIGALDVAGLVAESVLIHGDVKEQNANIMTMLQQQAASDAYLANSLDILASNGSSPAEYGGMAKGLYNELAVDTGATIGQAGASAIVYALSTGALPATIAAAIASGGFMGVRAVTGGNSIGNLEFNKLLDALEDDTFYKEAMTNGLTSAQARNLSDTLTKLYADRTMSGDQISSSFWTNDEITNAIFGGKAYVDALLDTQDGQKNLLLRLEQALGEEYTWNSDGSDAKSFVEYTRGKYGKDATLTQTKYVEGLKLALDYVYKQGNYDSDLAKKIDQYYASSEEGRELINKYYGEYVEAYKALPEFLVGLNATQGTNYQVEDFTGVGMEAILDTVVNYAADMQSSVKNLLDYDRELTTKLGATTQVVKTGSWTVGGSKEDDTAGMAMLMAINGIPESVKTALSEVYGIGINTSIRNYSGTDGEMHSDALAAVSMDISKLKDVMTGWTVDNKELNIDVANLSANDVSVLAQAGIQVNADGTVTFMKAANAEASGEERTVTIDAAAISGKIISELNVKGLTLDFSGAETKLNLDASKLSGDMRRALFTISSDLAANSSDAMSSALSGLGKVLDSGYFELTNKAVLSGKQTVRGYLESMGYEFSASGEYIKKETDVLSQTMIEALLSIDSQVSAQGKLTAESVAKAANAIVIESPIKADELTDTIEAEFDKVGVKFIEEEGKLYAVISNVSENAAKGITILPESVWDTLNDSVKTQMHKLGVRWHTEAGLVTVDISNTMQNGANELVKIFVEQPELWDQIPESMKAVFEQAGLVAANGMLVINTNTLKGLVEVGGEWFEFWDQLDEDVIAGLNASELAARGGMMKIEAASKTDKIGIAADGSIVMPFRELPPELQQQMGTVSDEIRKGNVKITQATEDAFLGVDAAVRAGMNPAIAAAKEAGGDIAAAVAAALIEVQKLANVKISPDRWNTNTGAPKAHRDSDGTWTVTAGGYDYEGIMAASESEAITYAKKMAKNAGLPWPTSSTSAKPSDYAAGGIIATEGFYRAGEYGRKEGIIPLENRNSLGIIGKTIASTMLTNPTITSMYNGGVNPIAAKQSATSYGNTVDAASVAKEVLQYVLPAISAGGNEKTPVYVGTLVADDTGLKELERKMYDIREVEKTRRS